MLKMILSGVGLASLLVMSPVVQSETLLFTVNEAEGKTFHVELRLPDKRAQPSLVVVSRPQRPAGDKGFTDTMNW